MHSPVIRGASSKNPRRDRPRVRRSSTHLPRSRSPSQPIRPLSSKTGNSTRMLSGVVFRTVDRSVRGAVGYPQSRRGLRSPRSCVPQPTPRNHLIRRATVGDRYANLPHRPVRSHQRDRLRRQLERHRRRIPRTAQRSRQFRSSRLRHLYLRIDRNPQRRRRRTSIAGELHRSRQRGIQYFRPRSRVTVRHPRIRHGDRRNLSRFDARGDVGFAKRSLVGVDVGISQRLSPTQHHRPRLTDCILASTGRRYRHRTPHSPRFPAFGDYRR
ncbi:hypothetical protein CKA32_004349 [Geitlerinema sp. FC II]|nr:hypothetical protein CKA32_004349 [Geitlerinema sp. FC II]